MATKNGLIAFDRIEEVLTHPEYEEPLTKLAAEYSDLVQQGSSLKDRRLDEDLLKALGSESKKWNVSCSCAFIVEG